VDLRAKTVAVLSRLFADAEFFINLLGRSHHGYFPFLGIL